MDVIILCHGLGNQLSQYAFYMNKRMLNQKTAAFYTFKQHSGYQLKSIFNLSEGLGWYRFLVLAIIRIGLSRRYYSENKINFFLSLFRIQIITERSDYQFNSELVKPWLGLRIFYGGWHREEYFIQSEAYIRKIYKFPDLDGKNQEIIDLIEGSNSVSLHVRRGDYLDAKSYKIFGEISTLNYYKNAIDNINQSVIEPKFFIFSDDIAYCKENLKINNAYFVDINSGEDSWKDMVLMSKCKHNIIANSTFSWWAAWLNKNKSKKILCPKKFCNYDVPGNTIYPQSWIAIEG